MNIYNNVGAALTVYFAANAALTITHRNEHEIT